MNITKTIKSMSGTSFHDHVIKASYNDMVKAFGAPHIEFSDKTNHEWHLECGGTPFSIYDWKEALRPSNYPDELYEWHIGAFSPGESYHMFLSVHHYMEDMNSNSDYEDRLEHLLGHFSDPDEAEHYADMDPANWPEGVPAMPSEPEFDSAGFSITDRMEGKKQSSIDWLVSILNKPGFAPVLTKEEIEQARQMDKENLKEAYREGRSDEQSTKDVWFYHRNAESYYNETYGGNNE